MGKGQFLVDSQGSLIKASITSTNISNKQGLVQLLEKKKLCFPFVKKIWADHGYQGAPLKKIAFEQGIDLEIVKSLPGRYRIYNEKSKTEWIAIKREFSILLKRWVVEGTFAWISKHRLLSKDYEYLTEVSETYMYMGMTRTLLKKMIKI